MRPIVAGNPAAPAHLLATLATDQDEQVREQVASNSTALWHTLLRLVAEFPPAFLHNPVGQRHLLAHPEQISSDERFWKALLWEPAVLSWW